jgi:hypothetical protein
MSIVSLTELRNQGETVGTDWVSQYIDAWNTRNSARIVEWMTNDCVYEDVTLGESHTGLDDIAKFIDRPATATSRTFTSSLSRPGTRR